MTQDSMRTRIANAIWSAMIWDTPFPAPGTDDLREIMNTTDAVLAALVEPTDAMQQAGASAPLTMDDDVGFPASLRVWQAMIGAAQ